MKTFVSGSIAIVGLAALATSAQAQQALREPPSCSYVNLTIVEEAVFPAVFPKRYSYTFTAQYSVAGYGMGSPGSVRIQEGTLIGNALWWNDFDGTYVSFNGTAHSSTYMKPTDLLAPVPPDGPVTRYFRAVVFDPYGNALRVSGIQSVVVPN